MSNNKQTFTVGCQYCGHVQDWTFKPDDETESMADILKYDYEYICSSCGSPVRVNEALSPTVLQQYGY